jgi:rRNA processing protein Gar1
MSNPEVEVRSFKQQGGECLKDAWYRISDAHNRCTKKHSTTILLRNFYVGIPSWNRYVLDCLAGGNFLGAPALEASCIIESLFGTPPVVETKLEMLLDKTDELDKSLGGIDERISVLGTCVVYDDQINRIGELEKAMGTLGSTFSSIKFREKAYVGKEQKFMYVSKVPKPKKYYYRPKIDKALSTTTDGGAYDINASPLDNT